MKLNACALGMLDALPESLHEGLRLYFEEGITPGGFLTACIENNLLEAATRGDPENVRELPAIMRWIYNHVPSTAWGSQDKRIAWQNDVRGH